MKKPIKYTLNLTAKESDWRKIQTDSNVANHWLNWNSQSDNVVVSNDSSLCVGTCLDDEKYAVDQKLGAGVSLSEAVAGSPLKLIRFKSIVNLRSVRNDTSVSITVQKKSSEETLDVDFGSCDKAEEFYDHVSQYVSSNLNKVVGDYSRYYGVILLACCAVLSSVFLLAFFDKHRFIACLLPIVCMVGALSYVAKLENEQRKITRWTSRPDAKLFSVPAIRAIGFCAIFSVFSWAVSPFLADQYGEDALTKAVIANSLSSSDVSGYMQRGSSIHYSDVQGRTALWWSLQHQNHGVSAALIRAGANVSVSNGALLEHALEHSAHEDIIAAMMDKGVLEVAELMSGFNTKQYIESNSENFTNAYYRYRNSARFNR